MCAAWRGEIAVCAQSRDNDVTEHRACEDVLQTSQLHDALRARKVAMEELKDDYREGESFAQYAIVCPTFPTPNQHDKQPVASSPAHDLLILTIFAGHNPPSLPHRNLPHPPPNLSPHNPSLPRINHPLLHRRHRLLLLLLLVHPHPRDPRAYLPAIPPQSPFNFFLHNSQTDRPPSPRCTK
jgi:hypothetical protein